MTQKKSQVAAILPARYASQRLPGKPLLSIGKKTIIQRTYEQALKCPSLDFVAVATDDMRIAAEVKRFQGNVFLTSSDCSSGTERICSLLESLQSYSIVVNVQGDEPFIEPSVIEQVIETLQTDQNAKVATAAVRIESKDKWNSPSVVKCVVDCKGRALYFSRGPIPYPKEGWNRQIAAYQHIGIYAYRTDFLCTYSKLPPTPLQETEDLEQLRIIEHGYPIAVAKVESCSFGIDTPEDLLQARKQR